MLCTNFIRNTHQATVLYIRYNLCLVKVNLFFLSRLLLLFGNVSTFLTNSLKIPTPGIHGDLFCCCWNLLEISET